jgi:hypothetical protein
MQGINSILDSIGGAKDQGGRKDSKMPELTAAGSESERPVSKMAMVAKAASKSLEYVCVDTLMNKIVQAHENEGQFFEKEVKHLFRWLVSFFNHDSIPITFSF